MNKINKKELQTFIDTWCDKGDEVADKNTYWNTLLRILGVPQIQLDNNTFIKYEKKIKLRENESFHGSIDAYIPSTKTLIEQKSNGVDLFKKESRPNGGDVEKITPFEQARRYDNHLSKNEKANFLVLCNFKQIVVYDVRKSIDVKPVIIELKDLEKDLYLLDFLVKKDDKQRIEKEQKVSVKAGELVSKIYDEFANIFAKYNQTADEKIKHSINTLCVRIVFCLYAEDANLFSTKEQFYDYLEPIEPHRCGIALKDLFKVLDTKVEDRTKNDPFWNDENPSLSAFPYVNGGLFHEQDIIIPPFTEKLKHIILDEASRGFDWSDISPAIFGAVFESTLNPETRRSGGMHYTSIENIHKVIDPLFLDDLKAELESIKQFKNPKTIRDKAIAFQKKLSNLTFLDPATGSGNFLTETFLSLRRLENEAIRLRTGGESLLDVGQAEDWIMVSIKQFYGIEINDFAVSVAKTAMWIAEDQMMKETQDLLYAPNWDFLPLKTYVNIHEGNALRMDWNDVIESYGCDYLIGNPPFVGQTFRTKEQKQDMINIFGKGSRETKQDYVICWYKKATDFALKSKNPNPSMQCAFVSTNSICQGESVPTFWHDLIVNNKVEIQFARKTFVWTNEAKNKAAVHCVIVGFTFHHENKDKLLFDGDKVVKCNNINPYLIPAENIWLNSRPRKPANKEKMTTGSPATDDGQLLLSKQEADDFIKNYPILDKYIKPFIGAREFLHDKGGNFSRYCFWFVDAENDLPKIVKIPTMRDRFERVKQIRLSSSATRIQNVASTPWLFAQNRQPESNYLVIPRVSSSRREYIPIGFMNENVITSDATTIIYNAKLMDLALLESNVHTAWMKTVAGRLKSDYRYSSSVYYNFPLPDLSEDDKEKLTETGQAILDARAKYPKLSLADLYDPLLMPVELQKAHQINDRAVLQAYMLPTNANESDIVAHLFKMYEDLTK